MNTNLTANAVLSYEYDSGFAAEVSAHVDHETLVITPLEKPECAFAIFERFTARINGDQEYMFRKVFEGDDGLLYIEHVDPIPELTADIGE